MSSFIRRFLTDPGDDVLLEIESVNILDLEPPSSIAGIGTGTIIVVGEFENGPFNTPTEALGASDLLGTFGALGYTYAGVGGQNACAVGRKADGALVAEAWNGNGFVQLSGKKFKKLVVVRVDTTVGEVQLTRLASITGAASFRYDLEPGQILALDVGAGATSATFTGTAATVTAVGGTYPTTFAGGETLTLGYDGRPNFTVTFLAADQANSAVVSRINAYAGFAFADLSGGQLRFTGRQRGSGAQVRVVSGSTGVLAQLGLTAANTAGTGNTVNIDAVTFAEVKTVVEAAVANTLVEQDAQGRLRASKSTATGTITVGAATTATALGFTVAQTAAAATGKAGTIPAGMVVKVNAGNEYVTAKDVTVTAASAGPYTVRIRPAVDDGTATGATAGAVAVVRDAPDLGSFACVNPQIVTAALSEAAIDAAYVTALTSTLDLNSVAKTGNIIFSARQSNAVRRALKSNAIDASAKGMFGRMALVRPPLNTLKADAKSTSSEPGVGATRDQRVVYCYPGARTFVPAIAKRGLAGGAGFTADGNVDVGADGFLASILSQLAPEENPGQETSFTVNVVDLESGANVKGFDIVDYTAFKAAGICALRMDEGTGVFQSGVTSVDPGVYPSLVTIARRRMADFIQDSVARRAKAFGKKLSTSARRHALASEIRAFMNQLLGKNSPGSQRINGFTVDTKSGNTPERLARGMYRIVLRVQTLASLDSIVIESTIGESVIDVEEVLPAAA